MSHPVSRKLFSRARALRALLVLIAVVALGGSAWWGVTRWQETVAARERAASPQGRLPEGVTPLASRLTLRADPRQERFSGQVEIDVRFDQATRQVWIHGQDLAVEDATLLVGDDPPLPIDYREMGGSGVVRLGLPVDYGPGEATLRFVYEAPFARDLEGLYLVEEDSASYAFTQFEALGARRVFPSFDEPRFKIPFDVTLEVPEEQIGLANTPLVASHSLSDGFQSLQFASTPPLPTYLLAFAIGELDVVEAEPLPPTEIRDRAVPLRGIAVRGKGGELQRALDGTKGLLETLEAYFGLPYPFAKLDLVAVPDFEAGAMENAGLITYREPLLLLGDTPSLSLRQDYVVTHAHELAHQWFGNLVTMPWWNDLWLNEAFAEWMAYKAAKARHPDLGLDREPLHNTLDVMWTDSYAMARPVREPIDHNGRVDGAFDGITYEKGGAVLAMFERLLGEETFRDGIRHHMERFRFGHAQAEDFVASLETVSGRPGLSEAFFSFLVQPGVPLVETRWSCSEAGVDVELSQRRYRPVGSSIEEDVLWQLPVCLELLADENTSEHCLLLAERQQTLSLADAACPEAVLPDSGAGGYYRWSLDDRGWDALFAAFPRLEAREKLALVDHLDAEIHAGRQSVMRLLDAVPLYASENEGDLILAPLGPLRFVSDHLVDDEERRALGRYLAQFYRPILDEIGLHPTSARDASDPVGTAELRRRLVRFLALDLEETDLRQPLTQLGRDLVGFGGDGQLHPEILDGDLVSTALAVAVQVEGEPYFDFLEEAIESSTDSTFRGRALRALGQTRDEALLERVQNLLLSFDVKLNEKPTVAFSLLDNPVGRDRAFDWLQGRFGMLAAILPDAYVARLPIVTHSFCDRHRLEEVRTFFEPRLAEIDSGPRYLAEALEQIELCAAMVESQPPFAIPPPEN